MFDVFFFGCGQWPKSKTADFHVHKISKDRRFQTLGWWKQFNSSGSELINVYMQVVRLAVPPGTGDLDQQLPFWTILLDTVWQCNVWKIYGYGVYGLYTSYSCVSNWRLTSIVTASLCPFTSAQDKLYGESWELPREHVGLTLIKDET